MEEPMLKFSGNEYYVLNDNGCPKREMDSRKWAAWMGTGKLIVAEEIVNGVRVKTVFLGIDYNIFWGMPPVLWETMVFGGRYDAEYLRASGTREQAEAIHARMVARMKADPDAAKPKPRPERRRPPIEKWKAANEARGKNGQAIRRSQKPLC
jgi:hypothetical protein